MPCICSCDTCIPSRLPACRACLITPCWEGPLGAVRLLLRPSWFTALPERRTRPGSVPSGTADAGTSIAQPTASALTYPSADASKVLHLQFINLTCDTRNTLDIQCTYFTNSFAKSNSYSIELLACRSGKGCSEHTVVTSFTQESATLHVLFSRQTASMQRPRVIALFVKSLRQSSKNSQLVAHHLHLCFPAKMSDES